MKTIELSRETLLEEILGNDDAVIRDTIVENSRWSIHHSLIFQYEQKIYRVAYSVGATESQEESPWENEDLVECVEVREVREVIINFVPVEEGTKL